MGRQQQLQVLKGLVKQTLLRRLYTSPTTSHPHRDRPSLAAAAAAAAAVESEKGLRGLSDSLNPKSFMEAASSRIGVSSKDLSTAPEHDAPPSTIDELLPPEAFQHLSPLFSSGLPLQSQTHFSPVGKFLPENCWASALSRCWPRALGQWRLLSPSGSAALLGGGLRGFASSGGKDIAKKVDDEGVGEACREGQGGDEGVSASVSGRQAIDDAGVGAKKRRGKRKSLIREVEALPQEESSDSALATRASLAVAPGAPDASAVDKPLRAPRRKRSKETPEEKILRAFNENALAIPEALEVPAPELTKPSSAALEEALPALSKAPKLAAGCSPASSTPNVSVQRASPSLTDSKVNGNASPDRPPELPVKHTKAVPLSAVLVGQVEEILRKESLNSGVVEVPAVRATAEQSMSVPSDGNGNGSHHSASAQDRDNVAALSSSGEDEAKFSDPRAVYRTLVDGKSGRAYRDGEKAKLLSIFYRFAVSGWVSDQALSLYINSKFFPTAASRFRKFFMHRSSSELRSYLVAMGATNEALQFLFPIFAEFCIFEFPNEISRYRELVNTADMTKPDAWYPFARAIKRRVIYHKGPTNSGKTYNALKRFMEASSGIYCSPLRLLAMEVFDTVNMQGVYCNLHTGQEKKDVPFANHLACTVEMCYLTRQWDVAVIDEIQMMNDEYRGWAWTRAFLGLQADEIHVCGDPSALPLIRNLCNGTGDDLVEHEYERFMPLKVSEDSLRGDFRNIETGDCIVAFSRRDIFDIKREVELASKHRCCVVYGALPPETRTQQAKLFNEPNNGYNVLVASDAIGMGLNLNIRRVVFFSLDKFDGDSKKPLPPAQVKQIAGRAGRRGSLYPEGVTTTFFSQDLPYLSSSMQQDFEPAKAAGLFPVYEQVELFASQLPNETFAKLLERFSETCRLDGAFFLCRYDNLKRVANMLEKVKGLSLEDRFNFCFAPVNVRDPQSMGALYRYATAFSQKIPVNVEMGVPSSRARDEFELLDLEARHQVLSMYLWLTQHFPGNLFPQKEEAEEMASQIAVLLGQSLVQSSGRWAKRKLNEQQRRGRPVVNMGRSGSRHEDMRQGDSLTAERPKPAEIFVQA